jgi:hypothetical protein
MYTHRIFKYGAPSAAEFEELKARTAHRGLCGGAIVIEMSLAFIWIIVILI